MFTREHYEAIAKVLKESYCDSIVVDKSYLDGRNDAVILIRLALEDMFVEDNDRFNRDQFKKAVVG